MEQACENDQVDRGPGEHPQPRHPRDAEQEDCHEIDGDGPRKRLKRGEEQLVASPVQLRHKLPLRQPLPVLRDLVVEGVGVALSERRAHAGKHRDRRGQLPRTYADGHDVAHVLPPIACARLGRKRHDREQGRARHGEERPRERVHPLRAGRVGVLGLPLLRGIRCGGAGVQITLELRDLRGEIVGDRVPSGFLLQGAVRLQAVLEPLVDDDPIAQRQALRFPGRATGRIDVLDSARLLPEKLEA